MPEGGLERGEGKRDSKNVRVPSLSGIPGERKTS
jgi:hypothetical protein